METDKWKSFHRFLRLSSNPADNLAKEITHVLEVNFNKVAPSGKRGQDHATKTQDTTVGATRIFLYSDPCEGRHDQGIRHDCPAHHVFAIQRHGSCVGEWSSFLMTCCRASSEGCLFLILTCRCGDTHTTIACATRHRNMPTPERRRMGTPRRAAKPRICRRPSPRTGGHQTDDWQATVFF